MKYFSWILPSGRIHSHDQTVITEGIVAECADLFPSTIFFYTDEKIATEDYEDRSWVRRLARRPSSPMAEASASALRENYTAPNERPTNH